MTTGKQIISFAGVGAVATVAQLAAYATLRLGASVAVATAVSLVFSSIVSTALNRRVTFKAHAGVSRDQIVGLLLTVATGIIQAGAGEWCIAHSVTGMEESLIVVLAGCLFGVIRFGVLKATMGKTALSEQQFSASAQYHEQAV